MFYILDAAAESDDIISAATRGFPDIPCSCWTVQPSVFSVDQWAGAASANTSPSSWALPLSGVGAAGCGTRRSVKGAVFGHHPGCSAFNTTSATAVIGSSEDFK